jgi:hypothetical protein
MLAAAQAGEARTVLTVRFGFVPQRAFQGKQASIAIHVTPANVRCALAVRYADGTLQGGFEPALAVGGRAAWSWQLPLAVPAGPATAFVSCAGSARIARRFVVVGGTALPSKLHVLAQGWSQRPDRFGSGSTVSYGVQLRDPSAKRDAQNVTVLVNFLDGAGVVLGTSTTNIAAIGASSTYNLGGFASLPTQTSVARLEIVVQTGAWAQHALHEPAVENVHVVPSALEPAWVGSVDGDLINDDPTQTLAGATLSIVFLDATGKIVGGGSGFVFDTLPPGTRAAFSATSGLSPVAVANAATIAISVAPTYKA